MGYTIKNAVSSSRVPAWGNQKKYIAVHYLGVDGQGHDLASDGCGAHYYIYWDGTIYQRCSHDAIPWAVGTAGYYTQKHPKARNSNTISIEMCCHNTGGNAASAEDKHWWFTKETQEACAWLVAKLMRDLKIPLANVLRHYDIVNKICPNPYVYNNKFKESWTWNQFKNRVKEYYNGTAEKPVIQKGRKVKLTEDVLIRTGVSTKAQQAGYRKYTDLTASAKKKSKRVSGNKAKLKKKNVVQVLEVKTSWNGDIWIRIKNGWLPVYVKGKYRVASA